MGADNLFHKRRERREGSFQRKVAWRKVNDVVLLVCQGKKTEPLYLRGLQTALRIQSGSMIVLESAQGRDSLNVVRTGINAYARDTSDYDRVYCVFDKDDDKNYGNAVQLARNHELGKRKILFAVTSVPCFEIWLLLHFEYTAKAFVKSGNKSPCDNIISALNKPGRIPNYAKNQKGIYELVGHKTSTAMKYAKRLSEYNGATGSLNPSTTMHELVAYLKSIAPKEG